MMMAISSIENKLTGLQGFSCSSRTTIFGAGLPDARRGSGLIGLEGINDVMISEDASESSSSSSSDSTSLSESEDSEEEDVDISKSSSC